MSRIPLRWIAIGVFILSSSLNYLDRQLLAALAPTVRGEFQLSNEQYGLVISSFSLVYATVAPAAGWFIDRVGLNLGAGIPVALWSMAGAATAWTRSFSGLLACRTVLGAAEAAGIPATGKANATYLEPRELALGTAFNQVGITLGSVAAPLIVTLMQPRYGWRSPFALCGALGFLWIPLWLFTAKRVPARPSDGNPSRTGGGTLLRDRRFWGLALANAFVMTLYALWSNWTTLYFVQERHMTQDQANREFAWIPAVFATAGGFFGGVVTYRWIRAGMNVLRARMRICWISAVILLFTAAVPLMPYPALAAVYGGCTHPGRAQTAHDGADHDGKYHRPARVLPAGQNPQLLGTYGRKNSQTDDNLAEAKNIPADHSARKSFHPDREQQYIADCSDGETDQQLVNGSYPVKPMRGFDIFGHTC